MIVESTNGVNKKQHKFSSIANVIGRSNGLLGKKNPPEKIIDTSFVVSVRYQRTHICQGTAIGSKLIVVPDHCINCQLSSQPSLQVFTDKDELHDEIDVSKIGCPDQISSDAITYLWVKLINVVIYF